MSLRCYCQWGGYMLFSFRGSSLLVGDKVLAVLQTLNLELVALCTRVDVLDVICGR